MPPDAKAGIIVPVAQIACGGIMIAPEQNRELEIALNACASVVQNGANFVLKPVAWGRSRRIPPPG
jgi:hypothetical protein